MMQYEKYKPSGIQWTDSIPQHWKIYRIKNICSYVNRGTTPNYVEFSDFKVVNQATFSKGYFNEENIKFTSKKETLSGVLKYNDILIASTGGGVLGKTFFFNKNDKNYIADSHVTILRDNKKRFSPSFIHYFFSINYHLINELLAQGSTNQTELQKKELLAFELAFPPLSEQSAITQYLDTKTQAIDTKTKLLTQKTNYYKELRKSIINDLVCKGLDKNANTIVNELGFNTNSKYAIHRLKDIGFLYSGLSGKAGDDFNQDDNPNNKGFIPFTNIANNTYLKANHLGTVVVCENEKQNKVRQGDLFFLMSSEGYEDIGKTAALAEDINDIYLNSFCKGYRITKKNCDPNFLNYLMLSDNYRKALIVEGKGFTRINLKMEKVSDFIVYLPPTKVEQTQIATYLDEKTQMIDAIVSNIAKQIDTLKELRKTLINDVVTGKIKVTA